MTSTPNQIASSTKPRVLCVILARAGSKGLPNKNALLVNGRPLIEYTIDHAKTSSRIDQIVLSTDGETLAAIGRDNNIVVSIRPEHLANDTATVDDAARHCVETIEASESSHYDAVVILYGNVPMRPRGLIDDAVDLLLASGCDSVQSVHPVGKQHPYWMKTVDAEHKLSHYQPNSVYRRQDLPPVYMLDGAIIAVTRARLFDVNPNDAHAFLGEDRRAIVTPIGETVDIDDATDLQRAEVLIKEKAANNPAFPLSFSIGNREVGEAFPSYVIAEIGVNHDGSIKTAIDLVNAAKAAGADAVKVQLFDPALLLSEEAVLAAYQQKGASNVFEMLANLQLSVTELADVRDAARQLNLGFIATCFSIELYDAMEMLDPDAVKFASPDAVNLPLIETMASLNKPLLISTGTCSLNELLPVAELLRGRDVAFLHCVSSYPVPNGEANLPRIETLRQRLSAPIGYSDHTSDLYGGMLAVASHRACIIEKHLTHDRTANGPDHAASFDPAQFAQYVSLIKAAWASQQVVESTDLEDEVRQVSRQSVCAARAIRAGQIIQRGDLTVKRPGTGIPAAQLNAVVGRVALRNVPANQLLHDNAVSSALPNPDGNEIAKVPAPDKRIA